MSARVHVSVKPALYHWACERNGQTIEGFLKTFPKLNQWAAGEASPTVKQLESFAAKTRTPFGYFFLDEPPEEPLPINDFRTLEGTAPSRPSPDLLDILYTCLRRQDWYRDYAEAAGEEPRSFVGSAKVGDDVVKTAAEIRRVLDFDPTNKKVKNWEDALRSFVEKAEAAGILVMRSGMVGHHHTRKLEVEEMRGFALADKLAPVVFVNANDAKAAQMFTMAHEIAHLWTGESALSDPDPSNAEKRTVEKWCDAVAAETLVPLRSLDGALLNKRDVMLEVSNLATLFRVSQLVILIRLRDAKRISQQTFVEAYEGRLAAFASQRAEEKESATGSKRGPSFYQTAPTRLSKRFARAVVRDAIEGRTLYRDALALIGAKNVDSLTKLGKRLEVDS